MVDLFVEVNGFRVKLAFNKKKSCWGRSAKKKKFRGGGAFGEKKPAVGSVLLRRKSKMEGKDWGRLARRKSEGEGLSGEKKTGRGRGVSVREKKGKADCERKERKRGKNKRKSKSK